MKKANQWLGRLPSKVFYDEKANPDQGAGGLFSNSRYSKEIQVVKVQGENNMITDGNRENVSEEMERENEVPNAETLAAIKEVEDMIAHPERYKTYSDFSEILKDLLSE